jgi:hypothetical protein
LIIQRSDGEYELTVLEGQLDVSQLFHIEANLEIAHVSTSRIPSDDMKLLSRYV